MRAGRNSLAWNGRHADGQLAPDGDYSLVVAAGFARVFSGWEFMWDFAALVLIGHGVSFALRRLRAPLLIINDDVELCARYPTTGLHIGQDDTSPAEARRRIGPDRVIGLSTHSFEQARAADALAGTIDYFCVGPVFATQTKPDYTPVGPELVRRVSAMKPRLPWFAIGGINRLTLREVLAAGASRVVVVSDLLCASSPREAATEHIRALRSPTPFTPQ